MRPQDLCAFLNATQLQASNLRASGVLPKGHRQHPGRGNAHTFSRPEGFWFALALVLHRCRLPGNDCKTIADGAQELTKSLKAHRILGVWDPFNRYFEQPADQWLLEVSDHSYVRLVRKWKSKVHRSKWHALEVQELASKDAQMVTIRIDLTDLARCVIAADERRNSPKSKRQEDSKPWEIK